MRDDRRRVLLTGATGNWGRVALREFRDHPEFVVRAFTLDTPGDRAALAEFEGMENLEIVFGDLMSLTDVSRAIESVSVVLHVGGVVPPLADCRPRLAHQVNVGSMSNIIRAVLALPDPSTVGVVAVGSIAEMGDRQEPHHWGRVGDPVRVAQYDAYALSKVVAERLLVDSGLPKWAWLRQTGILHPGMLGIRDPIVTHPPIAGVLEWVSVEDSARLLAGLASPDVPDEFWGRIHNIGGGDGWRLTNWELEVAIARAVGVRDVRTWYNRNWFALKNFHGLWFADSDRLNELVPFRMDTFDGALARAVSAQPSFVRHAGRVPGCIVKQFVMRPLTRKPRGTMHAITRRVKDEIGAFFGSREAWRKIGDWSTFTPPEPCRVPSNLLELGFDEDRDPRTWTASDYREAARFRGGELLSDDAGTGRITVPLLWRCAFGHAFAGSPRLILACGHWCPDCVREPTEYAKQAESNPFLAQLETSLEPVTAGAEC